MKTHSKFYLFVGLFSLLTMLSGCNKAGFYFKKNTVIVVNEDKTRQKERVNANEFVLAQKEGERISLSAETWNSILKKREDGSPYPPDDFWTDLDTNQLSFQLDPKFEKLIWENDVMVLNDLRTSTPKLRINMQDANGLLFRSNEKKIEVAIFGAQVCLDAHDVWAMMAETCPASNSISKLRLTYCDGELWGTCLDENDEGIVVILIDPAVLDPISGFRMNPNVLDSLLETPEKITRLGASNLGFVHLVQLETKPAQLSPTALVPGEEIELPCDSQTETDLKTLIVRRRVHSIVECDGQLTILSDDEMTTPPIDIRLGNLTLVKDEVNDELSVLCSSKSLIKYQDIMDK